MNRFAYLATGRAIRMLSRLSDAEVILHGSENIPRGSNIFVINHFTRIETVLIPYHIYQLTKVPVWSLADFSLFEGPLRSFLDAVGSVSTRDPHRDLLIVKSLLTGEADWVIYPEGEMVKDKRIVEAARYMISSAGGKRPPHTGAAVLALRTEFYRQRLAGLVRTNPDEAKRLMELFQIDSLDPVLNRETWIVPVNITYYPIRARENALSRFAPLLVKDLSPRALEELMAEGTLFLSDTDIDIRFGDPIPVREYLVPPIDRDIASPRRIDFDDPLPSRTKMLRVAIDIMRRYMDAIYSMTTVNHDHLFASMLRVVPLLRMNEDNLRRRVFLATTEHLEQMEVHLHRSLRTNQISLLTDDRFHKFRDFMQLAVEKGIIAKEGHDLVKDMSKFSSPFDLNRARIDNPVAVIANEVIPLKQLQRRIEAIAWMAPFQLRQRIAVHLQKKGEKEFADDYAAFFAEGETKAQEIGAPRLFRGKSREVGVVLLHGFLAAPYEMKELADYLVRRGYWVHIPRVKGHGTSAGDLATRTGEEWRNSVDEAYALMSNVCQQVVVGGFSFGGGLALDLAARVPELAGVFAVCPPMKLQDISSRFAQAADFWNRLMDLAHYEAAKKEYVEISLEHPHINYGRVPISGISEMERFMEALEQRLGEVTVPALVVQSQGDPVVDPAGSRKLFEQLASSEKDYLSFEFDRHGILMDAGSERVHAALADFVGRIGAGTPVGRNAPDDAGRAVEAAE